jgi:hypothetical protein
MSAGLCARSWNHLRGACVWRKIATSWLAQSLRFHQVGCAFFRSGTARKANATTFAVQEYFFRQLTGVRFGLYALTLNKDRLYPELQRQKDRTYNYLARLILDHLSLENATDAVNLVLDRRKNRKERQEFNAYIQRELANRLPPRSGCGSPTRIPSTIIVCRRRTCSAGGFSGNTSGGIVFSMRSFRGKSVTTASISPRNKKERALQAMVPGFVPPDGGTVPRGPTEDSPLIYRVNTRGYIVKIKFPITP